MALSFLYVALRRLVGAACGRFRSESAKDIEIAVPVIRWPSCDDR
jgi:hypothetical protein